MSGETRIVSIAEIIVGERRREEFGNLVELAMSIEKHGPIHPIVIDSENRLVAGERRLRACREVLGWDVILARDFGALTDTERREIELEENLHRKDLTAYERSKTLVTLAETAAEVLRAEPETLSESDRVSRRGPKPKPDAEVRVAERISVPQPTLNEARQHVKTADQFPILQKPEWKQSHVLQAGKHLHSLSDEEQKVAVAMVSEPFIPPTDAVQILENLAEMPEGERKQTLDLYQSEHPQDQKFLPRHALGSAIRCLTLAPLSLRG